MFVNREVAAVTRRHRRVHENCNLIVPSAIDDVVAVLRSFGFRDRLAFIDTERYHIASAKFGNGYRMLFAIGMPSSIGDKLGDSREILVHLCDLRA